MSEVPFELLILGPTELRGPGPPLDDAIVRQPKRLALLAYLALATADGYRRRDQIVGLFWPDLGQGNARTQLRKALHTLRDSLGADAIVSRGEDEVRLDQARVRCDAVALRQRAKEGKWADALALYRGELLEGLFADGVAQEFDEWLGEQRKALRQRAARAAWECAGLEEARGDHRAAAVLSRRALELAPDDEEGVRRLMRLLDWQGDRGGALRVYADWQARLQAEYGVEPAPETRKLARTVQAARKGESHETPPTPMPPTTSDSGVGAAPASRAVRVRPRRHIVAAAFGLLAIVAAGSLVLSRGGGGAAPAGPYSVAVLPLRAIGDPGLESVADGIAEELTTALAMVPGYTVRSATRARDAVARGGDVDRIGRRLGVAYVVDGAVQRAPGRLRVTLRLVRAADATVVWAGTFDLEASDVARAEAELAVAASAQMRPHLVGTADSTVR